MCNPPYHCQHVSANRRSQALMLRDLRLNPGESTASAFARIDTNGDELVSREELRAANTGSQWELLSGEDAGWVRDMPDVAVLEFDGGYVLFEADADAAQVVLQRAAALGAVHSFTPRRPTRTEIFREVVK